METERSTARSILGALAAAVLIAGSFHRLERLADRHDDAPLTGAASAGAHRLRLGLLLCGLLVACQASRGAPPPTLPEAVLRFVEQSQGDTGGAYRPPGEGALRDLPRAVLATAGGRGSKAEDLLAPHAYRSQPLGDGSGVRLLLPERVPDERGWGLYAVLPAGRPLAVEVPHPRADRDTEDIGADLAERVEAQHLLVAGAHRDRADGDADVAHREASLFAAVHAALARRGLPAVQVHGFAQPSSPGNDVVVSPGSAPLSPLAVRIAAELDAAGFRTCRAWVRDCDELEGRTNTQASASAETGAAFVHVEVSRPVRDDRDRRDVLVDALAAAVTTSVPLPADR